MFGELILPLFGCWCILSADAADVAAKTCAKKTRNQSWRLPIVGRRGE